MPIQNAAISSDWSNITGDPSSSVITSYYGSSPLITNTGKAIKVEDIVTKDELIGNLSALYEWIYQYYCVHEPDMRDSYEILLRLNNYNFRKTVLQIELDKQKKEQEDS